MYKVVCESTQGTVVEQYFDDFDFEVIVARDYSKRMAASDKTQSIDVYNDVAQPLVFTPIARYMKGFGWVKVTDNPTDERTHVCVMRETPDGYACAECLYS